MEIAISVLVVVAAICGCISIYQDITKRLEERKKYPSRLHWDQKIARDRKAMFERDQFLIQALDDYHTGGGGSYSVNWLAPSGNTLTTSGAKINEHEYTDCLINLYDKYREYHNNESPHQESNVTPLLSLKRGEGEV
jgi:hypothetical protein